jgi:hypothetical protein
MFTTTHSEQLGSADGFAQRVIATHLVHALRHAAQGEPINGMRRLLAAMDAVSTIDDKNVRINAFELCRYCELAFIATQHEIWKTTARLSVEVAHV